MYTPNRVIVTSSRVNTGFNLQASAALAAVSLSCSLLSIGSKHICDHLSFHFSVVSGRQSLPYPLAFSFSINLRKSVILSALDGFEMWNREALEMSCRVRQVDRVAASSQTGMAILKIFVWLCKELCFWQEPLSGAWER